MCLCNFFLYIFLYDKLNYTYYLNISSTNGEYVLYVCIALFEKKKKSFWYFFCIFLYRAYNFFLFCLAWARERWVKDVADILVIVFKSPQHWSLTYLSNSCILLHQKYCRCSNLACWQSLCHFWHSDFGALLCES